MTRLVSRRTRLAIIGGVLPLVLLRAPSAGLAARGESWPAFAERCIPSDCVAPSSNTPSILGRRALSDGRIARLGATAHFHHGLLARDTLPSALSDQEFWSLTGTFSEPDGYFRSNSGSPDNLLSNENIISTVAAALAARVKPSGVYLGVGPEQNFTYIAAIRPRFAVITDIRRGNLHLHLMYKALFEMSATRADFVTRLFTRRRPAGLGPQTTVAELMTAFLNAEPGDEATFAANLKAITDHLTRTRRLPLDNGDLAGIEYVYRNFHQFGPAINYTSSIGRSSGTTYATLMATTDRETGVARTYLASEESFGIVKSMQSKNLIIPVVGDFAGPKALRAIGTYLKDRGAVVTAFYVSNVEMYLQRNGVWRAFCANVAAMPLDAASTFVRPSGSGLGSLSSMTSETADCAGKSAVAPRPPGKQ